MNFSPFKNLPDDFPLPLRIGTRESPMAMVQAQMVLSALENIYPALKGNIKLCPMKTSGDILFNEPLYLSGGKGLFTKELEHALLSNRVDLAVHSLKDMPTRLPDGLMLSCFLKRTEARDAFVSFRYESLNALPLKGRLGTSSIRRAAQSLNMRPDLTIVPLRGNVNTRLQKIKNGEMDGSILSFSGLERLNLEKVAKEILDPMVFVPAPGQGVICIEILCSNKALQTLLLPLNDLETQICIEAERAVLKSVDGSCRVPVGAWAKKIEGDKVHIQGFLAETTKPPFKASRTVLRSIEGPFHEATELGKTLGYFLKKDLLC
ncbi:MAG TPA: hydroxymethylbilane synthase [Alphaproteobacteria bacterium]|nr:hydroxymethylbilane synthase [Alphaproteobacteria bacterium]HQS94759.1 hydroxymethylbilane synthase [Alphaproteobacteria bacterium]